MSYLLRAPFVSVLLIVGCQGVIGSIEADPTYEPVDEGIRPGEVLCDPSYTPMRRLTDREYRRVLVDLLGEEKATGIAALELPADLKNDLVENGEGDQVRRRAVEVYWDAADGLITTPVFAECSDVVCSRAELLAFAERAFRRPLDAERVASIEELFAAMEAEVGRNEAERLAVVSLLQSPSFLYRMDVGVNDGAGDGGDWVDLDNYDIASRLSFLFTGRGPDEVLLGDAAAGRLGDPEVRAGHVERLLRDDDNQRYVVSSFLRLWVDTEGTEVSYDGRLDDLFPAEMVEFMRHIAFVDGGSFADLVTSPQSFLNRDLANHYGLSGADELPDQELVRVEGSPRRMVGMLSMGDIVARGGASGQRSIHRGKFVLRRLVCSPVPLPDQATLQLIDEAVAEEPPAAGQAHRDYIADLTSGAECAHCHGMINPAGFAFENFDNVGRWQDFDGEHEVDASGVMNVRGEQLVYDDLRGFGDALSTSDAFRDCFIRDLFAFVYGRRATESDGCLLEELQSIWDGGHGRVADLFTRLTTLRLFSAQPTTSEGGRP